MANKLNQFTTHSSQFTNFAFTLAETLIVMGIIGVVAALTLPNLNSSTGDKEKVVKVKKIYSNIEDAYGRATAVYGPMEEWFASDSNVAAKSKRVGERITEFMKISKSCTNNVNAGCFTTGKYNCLINNAYSATAADSNSYMYITADGTALSFKYVDDNYIHISFDIDGPNKGKFTVGIDYFSFDLKSDGLYRDNVEPSIMVYCAMAQYPSSCVDWIMKFDNMDYTKINSSGKCINNTSLTLNGTNTSCK
ncbi:type II secretion system protein [bacterium]|nr:type II secretion system protein [bacterium]